MDGPVTAVGVCRFLAVSFGLLVFILAFIDLSGLFPELALALSSGAPELSRSGVRWVVDAVLLTGFVVLLVSPYRMIRWRWIRLAYTAGLVLVLLMYAQMLLEAIDGVRSGNKHPDIILASILFLMVHIGNSWAFWRITKGPHGTPVGGAA